MSDPGDFLGPPIARLSFGVDLGTAEGSVVRVFDALGKDVTADYLRLLGERSLLDSIAKRAEMHAALAGLAPAPPDGVVARMVDELQAQLRIQREARVHPTPRGPAPFMVSPAWFAEKLMGGPPIPGPVVVRLALLASLSPRRPRFARAIRDVVVTRTEHHRVARAVGDGDDHVAALAERIVREVTAIAEDELVEGVRRVFTDP